MCLWSDSGYTTIPTVKVGGERRRLGSYIQIKIIFKRTRLLSSLTQDRNELNSERTRLNTPVEELQCVINYYVYPR